MNGISSLKTASKAFPTEWSLSWIEALLLLGSGALVVVLHQSFNLPLSLPGHHGIEWMAILIIGRMSSRFRGAGTLSSVGASVTSIIPIMHPTDPFIWLVYLLPGPVLDLAFHYLPSLTAKVWFLTLIAGLAHITKPLVRLAINSITGFPFGSFRYGVVYPIVSHLLFGLIGGFIGAIIVLGIHRLSKNST